MLVVAAFSDGQPVYKGDDSLYTKYKLRDATASVETVDGKNPIQMLNELFHELHYEYVDVSNEVTVGTKFCVVLEIQGQAYRGEGTTKKMAKGNCAMAAVKALTDSGVIKSLMAEKDAKKRRTSRHVTGTSNSSLLDSAVIKLAVHFPDLQYRLVSQNDLWKNGQTLSSVAVTVRGETFFGSGPTESSAKNQVASKVLTKFGLWSADDQRLKQETARVEADSTITSVVRGAKAGGRKFSGRGFIGRGVGRGTSRGMGRGWNFSTSGFDGFSSMTSAYTPSVMKEKPGSEQIVSSSEWHASSVPSATAGIMNPRQDGKSFGRGTGITSALAQTAEFVTSKDSVNVRGRVSFRRGRYFADQARNSNSMGETWDTEGLKGTNRSGTSWHYETQDTSHAPSSEWHASSIPSATTGTTNPLQDGISCGRGAGVISAFAQAAGFVTSKDDVNIRGSGSFRRGGGQFHDGSSQGHLGQGSQSQPEISAGIRGDGIGRGRSQIDYPGQPSCNVGYSVESHGRYWQSDFSLPQESSGNTYQSSTTSTFGNKAAVMSTRGKSDGYFSGSSVKNTYSVSTQKHPNQKDAYFTSTRNLEKNQDFVDHTRNSNWTGETWNTEGLKGTNTYGSSWQYETQDPSSHALSAVNYAETDNAYTFNNEIPFSGNSKTETHLTTSQANEYFGSSSYEYESAGGYGDLYGIGSGYSYEH